MEYGIPAPRYRLPPDTHPGAVRLQVSDLGRSLEYYQRIIGLALLTRDRSSASLGRFVKHLGDVGAHVASADHAVSEALYLWDPDGLGIEVYADRPREDWRVSGQQIFMTTERLNVQGLLMAGGDEPWAGL